MSSCRFLLRLPSRHAVPHNANFALGRGSRVLSTRRSLAIETRARPSPHCVAYHASARLSSATAAPAPETISVLDSNSSSVPELYSPPKTGLLSLLPASWVPYAELARIDKPTGAYYLFFPCLWSTLLAAPMATTTPASVIGTSLLFFGGALIMRGAGCTINDLWDRNLDPHVTRTRLRPIARQAITPFQGLVFTSAQLFAGLGILLQFPLECFFYATPSLLFVATYPLAKRVTYYPQFVLGLTFSWGAIMGFPALGVDLLSNTPALTAAGLLYASNVAWTVLYDMIYAHMDIKDDAKAGCVPCRAGIVSGAGPAFFIGSCGGALVTLGIMIKRVNLKNVNDCWWWFVNGCWLTGGVVSLGLATDYLVKYVQENGWESSSSG